MAEGNRTIGFKCLHYSVPESAGVISLTILKKNASEAFSFGLRTIEVANAYGGTEGKGTATPEKEY